jgi:hypothetical protein
MRSLASLLAKLALGALICPIGLGACGSNKNTASNAGGSAPTGGESSQGGASTGGDSSGNASGGASTGGDSSGNASGGASTGGDSAGNASGGASSTGGSPAGCTAPVTVPDALMTDFSELAEGASTAGGAQLKWGKASKSLTGGTFVYGQDTAGADSPLGTVTSGALNITASVASGHYGGFGFYFGPNCGSDACAYNGFSFSIAGSTGGTDVDIQMQQVSDYPLNDNGKGMCDYGDAGVSYDSRWNYCTNPHVRLSTLIPEGVTADPQVVQVPWTALIGGNPVTNLDCTILLGIQIQFNAVSGSSAVNLTLDDLTFFK